MEARTWISICWTATTTPGCVSQGFKNPCSYAGKDMVKRLLDRDYNSRLSAADALNHPWIAEQCGEDDGCDVADDVLDLESFRRRRAPEHAHMPSIILPD